MDERRRRYYLTALGIDPWCARWPLPGGAPSPESPLEPEDADPAGPVAPAASPRKAPAPDPGVQGQGVSLAAVRDSLGAEETPEAAAPAEESTGVVASEAKHGQVVSAMIWHGAPFNLMALAQPTLPSDRQDRLGRNILRALGVSGATEATTLRWPPFDNPELPGNNDDNFQRVLDHLVQGAASGRWIILGKELYSMVGERVVSADHEIVLAADQTLGELLAEPAAKRALWTQIQPLIHYGATH